MVLFIVLNTWNTVVQKKIEILQNKRGLCWSYKWVSKHGVEPFLNGWEWVSLFIIGNKVSCVLLLQEVNMWTQHYWCWNNTNLETSHQRGNFFNISSQYLIEINFVLVKESVALLINKWLIFEVFKKTVKWIFHISYLLFLLKCLFCSLCNKMQNGTLMRTCVI